jgi:hypothetical protein
MRKSFFGSYRSTKSKDNWEDAAKDGSSVSKADIEEFGEKKFQDMCGTHGKENAVKEVARLRRNTSSDDKSESSADDSFGIEDTDVWEEEDSVECVLGAF